MKIVVLALGVLLFAGLAAIAGRIIYLASARDAQPSAVAVQPPAPRPALPPGAGIGTSTGDAASVSPGGAAAAPPDASSGAASSTAPNATVLPATVAPLNLPAGAVVRSVSISGDRLAVYYDGAGAEGIAVYDLASGRPPTVIGIMRAPD